MISLDITDDKPPRVGLVTTTPKSQLKLSEVKKGFDKLVQNLNARPPKKNYTPRTIKPKKSPQPMFPGGGPGGEGGFPGGGAPGAGFPGAGGGFPGAGGGFPGAGGGFPGGGGEGGAMGMGYDPSNPYGAEGGMIQSSQRSGFDKTVRYETFDQAKTLGLPIAKTIYPIRMVIVEASIPVKDQANEIRRALRLPDPARPGQPGIGGGVPMAGSPTGSPFGAPAMPMPVSGYPMSSPAAGASGPGGMNTMSAVSAEPYFLGFQVERQKINPKLNLPLDQIPFEPFNHEEIYFSEIRRRAAATMPEDPQMVPFIRPGQRLVAPLPQLADKLGDYPIMTMKTILAEIDRLKELNTPKLAPGEWEKRFTNFTGEDDPYAPISQGLYSGQVGANPMGGGYDPNQAFPGGGLGFPGGSPAFPGGSPSFPGGPADGPMGMGPEGGTGFAAMPTLDYSLMRFFDPTVEPGYDYRYRVRLVMYNPNFIPGLDPKNIKPEKGLDKILRQPTDAAQRELYGPWVLIEQKISIPSEKFLYAFNSEKYVDQTLDFLKDHGNEPALDRLSEYRDVLSGKKAVLQVQSWMPTVRIEGTKLEPVGSWVIADIPVARGEYIQKRQIVPLPLWSAGLGNYVLRDLAGGVKVKNLKDQTNQPKGWPINFDFKSVLVDFKGGMSQTSVNGTSYQTDSDSEVLILRPDGKLLVRSSGQDMANPARESRLSVWDAWVARVKDRRDVSDPTNPMNDSGFQRMP